MRNNLLYNDERNKPVTPDETLKATALIYLKEALVREEFEQCPELILKAKQFGAEGGEIRKVIAEHTRGVKEGLNAQEYKQYRGRRRF